MKAANDFGHAAELAQLEASAYAATRLMKLLANEQRLILVCKLIEGERSVGDLAAYTGLGQSAASQHLGKLRAEAVVATRRDAQTIYYRLANDDVKRILKVLHGIYCA